MLGRKPDDTDDLQRALAVIEKQSAALVRLAENAMSHAFALKNPTVALEELRLRRDAVAAGIPPDRVGVRVSEAERHMKPSVDDPDMIEAALREQEMIGEHQDNI